MKKLLSLLCLAFIMSVSVYSQIIEYEIDVKYNSEATGVTANITITVTTGKPGYIYYLNTNDPLKGQVIQKSEKIKRDHYTFKGVKPGTYFIKIEDNTGMFAGKSIVVNAN